MNRDAFAEYHPLINFIFYIGAFVGGMFFLHPAFVLCAVFFAALHYRIVKGRAAWHFLSVLLPLFIFLTVVNPVFNTYGDWVLFVWHIGSLIPERPYTTEALLYGMALGGMFISVLLWFASYNAEMTEDKFLYLFGRFSPSVSLVLTRQYIRKSWAWTDRAFRAAFMGLRGRHRDGGQYEEPRLRLWQEADELFHLPVREPGPPGALRDGWAASGTWSLCITGRHTGRIHAGTVNRRAG